jgi:hypothetical protein
MNRFFLFAGVLTASLALTSFAAAKGGPPSGGHSHGPSGMKSSSGMRHHDFRASKGFDFRKHGYSSYRWTHKRWSDYYRSYFYWSPYYSTWCFYEPSYARYVPVSYFREVYPTATFPTTVSPVMQQTTVTVNGGGSGPEAVEPPPIPTPAPAPAQINQTSQVAPPPAR